MYGPRTATINSHHARKHSHVLTPYAVEHAWAAHRHQRGPSCRRGACRPAARRQRPAPCPCPRPCPAARPRPARIALAGCLHTKTVSINWQSTWDSRCQRESGVQRIRQISAAAAVEQLGCQEAGLGTAQGRACRRLQLDDTAMRRACSSGKPGRHPLSTATHQQVTAPCGGGAFGARNAHASTTVTNTSCGERTSLRIAARVPLLLVVPCTPQAHRIATLAVIRASRLIPAQPTEDECSEYTGNKRNEPGRLT